MTSRIQYLFESSYEADAQLSGAVLIAALQQNIRDRLDVVNPMMPLRGDTPVWGVDRYEVLSGRKDEIRRSYRSREVLEALEGKILDIHLVQEEMDRLSVLGMGASLRNMHAPDRLVRHCRPGDRLGQHFNAIRLDHYPSQVVVAPNRELSYVRRYPIVAGRIAGDTPYHFCEETPLDLLDPANRDLQAEDFMTPLEVGDPQWKGLLRVEVEDFLKEYPLRSGAVDAGLRFTADGWVTPYIEEVTAAPPGAFSIFYADPVAYAEMIRDYLPEIEPGLFTEEFCNERL